MRTYLYVIPVVAAAISLVYIIGREMMRVWINHRVKVALLERLEDRPELLYSFEELQELLDDRPAKAPRQVKADLTLTGVFLALIGLLFVLIYAAVGRSQWAVGAYFGGVGCVVIGFLLTTVGLVVRLLRGPPGKRE